MKIPFVLCAGLISGLLLSAPVVAESPESDISANKAVSGIKMPSYHPPRRGAPSVRVGGGTRGLDRETPVLQVLAPDHVGLTGQEQPVLNWYMSKATTMRFEFLLIDDEGIEPVLELTINADKLKSGIQGLNLADYGIKLKPGVQYQWSVALVPDAANRSSDVISSGMIERQAISDAMANRLHQAKLQENAFIYAEEGYWYDAVAGLSGQIEKDPTNAVLKQQRAELLRQAGLPEAVSE